MYNVVQLFSRESIEIRTPENLEMIITSEFR